MNSTEIGFFPTSYFGITLHDVYYIEKINLVLLTPYFHIVNDKISTAHYDNLIMLVTLINSQFNLVCVKCSSTKFSSKQLTFILKPKSVYILPLY